MTNIHRTAPAKDDAVAIHTIEIPTADGATLGASLFEPKVDPRAQVIIHGATAVPHRYYRRFATFLAERGFRVLAYDYRGVGASGPTDLRSSTATMTEWAELDAPAAVARLVEERPDLPLLAVGHSFGGQVATLLECVPAPVGVAHVGAQLGALRLHPLSRRIRYTASLGVVVPALTAAAGYLPRSAGLGVALPSGVAREWASWCLSPDYYLSAHPEYAPRLASYRGAIYSLGFTDDTFAPPRTVRALLRRHPSARVVHQLVAPRDLGVAELGHFGAFREAHRATLWEAMARFFDAALAGPRAVAAFDGVPGIPAGPIGRRLTMEEVTADLEYGRA